MKSPYTKAEAASTSNMAKSAGTRITSFVQDNSGELYIVTSPEIVPDNTNKIVK